MTLAGKTLLRAARDGAGVALIAETHPRLEQAAERFGGIDVRRLGHILPRADS